MTKKEALMQLKKVLKSSAAEAQKAAKITKLADALPVAAVSLLESEMGPQHPLLTVALMDACFTIAGGKTYVSRLQAVLDFAKGYGDAGEELFMAARLALIRQTHPAKDVLEDVGGASFEIHAMAEAKISRGAPVAKRAKPSAKLEPKKRITIIIHGTWASDGTWWRPGGDFFEYVRKDLARKDLYGKPDQFQWSGNNRDSSRTEASAELNLWLKSHPAAEINVFAHSHGANVAMLATHQGTRFDRLIMLSPPVRADYFADWSKVTAAYNIQAAFDPVVAIAHGGSQFPAWCKVKQKTLKASGHSASHDPQVWRAEKLAQFVGLPWPLQ